MKATLVIMAAGMGSRYGGDKQVDGIGPNGEMLMEYSIFDAVRAGFSKVVLIIKPDIEAMIRGMVDGLFSRLRTNEGKPVEVCYVYQDFSSVPAFYRVPESRTKPFGTCHAVLCARERVQEPFIVINADDYYGQDAFRAAYDALTRLPETGGAAMVSYFLKNTVSEYGTVSRGVCVIEDGFLRRVDEMLKVKLYPNGDIRDISEGEDSPLLPGDTPVSMNFWCFTPAIFEELEVYFHDFLKNLKPDELSKECLLPILVDSLVHAGRLSVSAVFSRDRWFGMTYREDKPIVRAALAALHASGAYPPVLG